MDYGLMSDMELVMKIRSSTRKSGEYDFAKGEIIKRCYEDVRKSVNIYCMPDPEDRMVTDEVFGDLDRILLSYTKGTSLSSYLSAYAKKMIARPRWKLRPEFYRRAYAACAAAASLAALTFIFLNFINTGKPGGREKCFSYDDKGIAVLKGRQISLFDGTFIILSTNAMLESVPEKSDGPVKADLRLLCGKIECRVRKLKKEEYFRIETKAGGAEAVGTDFLVDYSRGVMKVEVREGRVLVFDKINETYHLIGSESNYETLPAVIEERVKKPETNESIKVNENREDIREPRNALEDGSPE